MELPIVHPWAKQFTFRVHFLANWRRNCFRRSGLSSIERYTWNNTLYWWLPCWNSMPRKKYQKDYLNRSHQHYINWLVVCNSKMRYTYIFARSAGSSHDQRALLKSDLWYPIEDSGSNDILPSAHHHIIGDSAFKLKQNLIVPYKDNGRLTVQRKIQ